MPSSSRNTEVLDSNQSGRAPANDHYEAATQTTPYDLDANGGEAAVDLVPLPDACQRIAIHVEGWDASGHVEVEFTDESGAVATVRDPSDNSDYSNDPDGDGTLEDVFVTVVPAGPGANVRIVDDSASGTSNSVTWSVMAI